MKAIWIRSDQQTVEAVEYEGLRDLQRMVGGYIELAMTLPHGDTLFVDEEGLLKSGVQYWFMIDGGHQPFAGNGVIVGKEVEDDSARGCHTVDPWHGVRETERIVIFAQSAD